MSSLPNMTKTYFFFINTRLPPFPFACDIIAIEPHPSLATSSRWRSMVTIGNRLLMLIGDLLSAVIGSLDQPVNSQSRRWRCQSVVTKVGVVTADEPNIFHLFNTSLKANDCLD